MMIILMCIVWYVNGFSSFVYWWTSKHDLIGEFMPLAVFTALLGPLNFLVGWLAMGDPLFDGNRVFFKKRQ